MPALPAQHCLGLHDTQPHCLPPLWVLSEDIPSVPASPLQGTEVSRVCPEEAALIRHGNKWFPLTGG